MVSQETNVGAVEQEPRRDNAFEEQAIRGVIDAVATAARAGDIDALLSHYTDDVVAYDMMPPLALDGVGAFRKNWEKGLELMPGGWVWEPANIKIFVDGNVGYATSFLRCGGTDKDGNSMVGWIRVTHGFRKVDGKWKIAHEHDSVPIDMNDSKGKFDLQPESTGNERG